MPILPASDDNIDCAARVLQDGGIAAFPTETVYGLGADAFNKAALARVFEIKRRPLTDPLIIHIAAQETLDLLVDFAQLSQDARRKTRLLIERFMPGSLTLVLPKLPNVPDEATAGLPSLAVRFPSHPVARRLIEKSTGAIAAPSANLFGHLSPTRAEHVVRQLGGEILVLDGGQCKVGLESTVLDAASGAFRILRHGGVPLEALREVVPEIAAVENAEEKACSPQRSPGQLAGHYAPRTPLILHSLEEMRSFQPPAGEAVLDLSIDNRENLEHAASQLFDKLHALDGQGFSAIHAFLAPEEGLGRAINDRLRRASAGSLAFQNPTKM